MDGDQRTAEWFLQRAGKVTASRLADVIAKTKTGYGAGRSNYRAQLVAERLTGKPQESFSNAAMQWGTDTEPYARMAYEGVTGNIVREVGFIEHLGFVGLAGASPDGLVGDDGLLEIKCPNTATHIEYVIAGTVPERYKPQMAWQMACTRRQWCDFVSFDPRMPEDLQLLIVRYERDEEFVEELEKEVKSFLGEVDETVKKLEEVRDARRR